MRKICVITGTRADYGLLYGLMSEINRDPQLELQIIATGMHLAPEFGLTFREIENDGFKINLKIEILLSSDSSVGVSKSMGLGIISLAEAYEVLKPDIVVVLGDRFEILAASTAALLGKIPLAHISGGDITEGALDDSIRHSITKMAHVHFVDNEISAARVRQLGEDPNLIFNVGNPILDYMKNMTFISKEDLSKDLGFKFGTKSILVTFHPETLSQNSTISQVTELIDALSKVDASYEIIITKANGDADGRIINSMFEDFSKARKNTFVFSSLGRQRYLSLLNHIDVVLGNSSSGLYEVPSFKKPTINIGNRQKGRILASSVISCECQSEDIFKALQKAFTLDCSFTVNPYGGDGNTAFKMKEILASIKDLDSLLFKKFFVIR